MLRGQLTAEAAFEVSRIDEEFQAERWGRDWEAEDRVRIQRDDIVEASKFLELLKS